MELRYVILARYAEYNNDSMLSLIGGDADKFVMEEFPFALPLLSAAVRLILDQEDIGLEHRLRCRVIRAETGETIAEGYQIEIPALILADGADDDAQVSIGLVANLPNIMIPSPGKYSLEVVVDEVVLGGAKFRAAPLAYYRARKAPKIIQAEGQTDDTAADHDQ